MAKPKASLSEANMMHFTPDQQTYTLRQYCEISKHAFPCFLTVTQGYYGGNEMEVLGNGQVLRIHSCVYQKRAVAVDSHNRTLSIPTNYPIKFKIVNAHNKVGKEEDTICNILVKKALPVKIQVSNARKISFSLTSATHNVHILGDLTIQEVYEETYFLANAIALDGMPNETASLIPLYLSDILVSPIQGIEGKTKSEWQAYQYQTTQACKRVKIPLDTGLKEIAMYSPHSIKSSDNVYEYIEPSSYIVAEWDGKIQSDETQTVTRPSLRKPPAKPPKPPKPLPEKKEDEGPPKLPLRVRQQRSNSLPGNSEPDKPGPPYENAIGRAKVAPFKQIAEDAALKATGSVKGRGKSPEEKDKPVDKLTIEELGERLKELKLDKYMKSFKENGVDGELAMDLSENILQEDFKFTKFESLKFLKFVRTGHVPK